MKKTKKVKKNVWRMPLIIGAGVLVVMILLAVVVLGMFFGVNNQQTSQNEQQNIFGSLKTAIVNPNKALCTYNKNSVCKIQQSFNINVPIAGKYKFIVTAERGNHVPPNECQAHEAYRMKINQVMTPVIPDLANCEQSGTINRQAIPGQYVLNKGLNTIIVQHAYAGKGGQDMHDGKPRVSVDSLGIKKVEFSLISDGSCGMASLNRMLYNTAPTTDLCSKGTNTNVVLTTDANGNRTWTWYCNGINGGKKSEACKAQGRPLPKCGDGNKNQESEECDLGEAENGKVCTPAYGESCTYCDASCKNKTVVGSKCGDGDIDPAHEECDDNSDKNGVVPAVGYGETKDYCKSDCTKGTVVGGQCGNGNVEGDEKCDLGSAENGKICTPAYGESCTYCDSSCQEQTVAGGDCGNGTKEGDEKCDEGDNNGKIPTVGYGETENYCKTDCTIGTVVGGQCGNNKVEGDEQCDDGNIINNDGCSSTCQEEKRVVEEKKSDCDASIGNYIWYDTNGNGIQEDIEEGIEDIKVCAYRGNKKYCDTTSKSGKYKIKNLCEGNYRVVVKDVANLVQTYDPDSKMDNQTKVGLKDGDKHTKADFGYRGSAPSTGLVTNIILIIGLSTLITIGVLLVMRKKGML